MGASFLTTGAEPTPCKDGVMTLAILSSEAWPPPVTAGFFRSRTLWPQVLTRPNEKSSCPRTCDAFRVMNPFESIAGRKIWRSTGAFVS